MVLLSQRRCFQDIFSAFEVLSYRETTLGANKWIEESQRMEFPVGQTMEDLLSNDVNGGDPSPSLEMSEADMNLHFIRKRDVSESDESTLLLPYVMRFEYEHDTLKDSVPEEVEMREADMKVHLIQERDVSEGDETTLLAPYVKLLF